jgi:predicted TIM-barrel fold metal-dependent hydrolase
MALIAIEEHWIMPDLTSALRSMPVQGESLAFNEMGDHQQRLEDLGAGRIAAMDAQGIDVSILALTPPGTQPLPPKEALHLSRAANDVAMAAVNGNPSRFRSLSTLPMSTLPMSSPRDVAGELERAAGMGHVGTMVYGRSGDLLLDDPVYDDFFAAAAELRRPVSDYIRSNFFITTSGMLNPALLRHVLSVTSVDRLIFSTDYPFQHPTREEINSFLGEFSSDADRQKFSSGNAASAQIPTAAYKPLQRSVPIAVGRGTPSLLAQPPSLAGYSVFVALLPTLC